MIEFAKRADIDEIMRFIDMEWRKNHILARDRAFFEYMYCIDDKVCFVISREECNMSINGILGFVAYDKKFHQISLSVWKALSSTDGMVGLGMLNYLLNQLKPKKIATPGINPKTTIALYKLMKFETGKMDHFYRLAKTESYKLALVSDGVIRKVENNSKSKITPINTFNEYCELNIEYSDNALAKEGWYIRKRYFEHPVYTYKVFLVSEESRKLAIFLREQQANDAKCIRIVDLIGDYDLLKNTTDFFDDILNENGYEYIDCYVTGIDKEIFALSGWENCEENDSIIPNYFSPFEKTKVDLYYSSKPQGIVMLRGDSDQDRPN